MQDTFSVAAIVTSFAIALLITVAMWIAHGRLERRRFWLSATALTAALIAIGVVDLLAASPRETPFTTVIVGAALPVFGVAGLIRATRLLPTWVRVLLAYVVAVILLYGGLLLGATIVPRFFIF
jgi:hypothetical protein